MKSILIFFSATVIFSTEICFADNLQQQISTGFNNAQTQADQGVADLRASGDSEMSKANRDLRIAQNLMRSIFGSGLAGYFFYKEQKERDNAKDIYSQADQMQAATAGKFSGAASAFNTNAFGGGSNSQSSGGSSSPISKYSGYSSGLGASSLASSKGFKIGKNSVTLPDGKTVSSDALQSADAFAADYANQYGLNKADVLAELSKAELSVSSSGDDKKGSQTADGGDGGGAGKTKSGDGLKDADGKSKSSVAAKDKKETDPLARFKQNLDMKISLRSPSAAGGGGKYYSTMFEGEPIGISADDIFKMVRRSYIRADEKDFFKY